MRNLHNALSTFGAGSQQFQSLKEMVESHIAGLASGPQPDPDAPSSFQTSSKDQKSKSEVDAVATRLEKVDLEK